MEGSSRKLTAMEFIDLASQELRAMEEKNRNNRIAAQSKDRVRNILGNNNQQLTPSQEQLAKQFERVIRGEPLRRKFGRGFFSVRGNR